MTNEIDNFTPQTDFLKSMKDRGYVHQCTDLTALDKKLSSQVVPAYIGFDCTATSLHVGSLVQIMMLRHLQKCGHKPIVLMGGGTTRIGDPTGRDESRKMLTDDDINANMAGIRKVFEKYLTFGDGPTDAVMVNNADWLDKLNYIEFLRDMGVHFTINRMLTFDSVKLRLEREQPMTFLEFNYMILQAYDYLELSRLNGCALQMGGSDQWGNIINGVELNRRVDQREVYGLTTPLVTLASGQKMGKSMSGAVWLNDDMLSSYDFWQFWRNTADADVGKFLRLFTELPLDEISRLENLEGAGINDAKKILANEATTLCHGEEAARAAEETARQAFEQKSLSADLPTITVAKADLEAGMAVSDLYVLGGLSKSKGEARRLIKQGGAKLNDEKISDGEALLTLADQNAEGTLKLSAGKKKHILIRPE
ncbi:tyrosine--tRNA ligase [Paremcibacter congregatus]|uniref:Tyrosine--tRNA ligase n=1 Tax=Paremcibacter congregatus TaxID=2043170 RepID=A0A2G4YMP7_9PROT|nr:tyrosine--tRNA ligase [Paremcibacter congregatus]PHZ83609.1 tyrosine--tRNA ligase [Paremcibacter congregatus]QDE27309.1 tyrosine--tRNA ligase [Paremcibacter congregatus]